VNMDHIIVLSKGRIVEQGNFDELVRAKGLFASMAARQGIFAAA
jgi:ABC-type multidrug transport system fused ATPase/permease subunit